jgi:hypothetical protein
MVLSSVSPARADPVVRATPSTTPSTTLSPSGKTARRHERVVNLGIVDIGIVNARIADVGEFREIKPLAPVLRIALFLSQFFLRSHHDTSEPAL